MSPSHAAKGGRRYRYYVSQAILQGRKRDAGSIVRVPAMEIERRVAEAVRGASRPSIGTLRLPSRAKRPTGGGRGGRAAVSRPSGSCGRRPRGLLDRRVLHLIKMWLDCRVEETDDRGRRTRTTEARDKRRGIPQGSPISPLLANLYMRRFVLGWKMFGLERALGTRLITYADDLVILCRRGKCYPTPLKLVGGAAVPLTRNLSRGRRPSLSGRQWPPSAETGARA